MTIHLLRPLIHDTPLPAHLVRDRAIGQAVRALAATATAAIGRLLEAHVNRLMRSRMKRALHAMSDHLLADIGMTRSEIDAAVDGLIPPSHGRTAR
jgi:uncharacterized protein YjiS (DUF1127 family)